MENTNSAFCYSNYKIADLVFMIANMHVCHCCSFNSSVSHHRCICQDINHHHHFLMAVAPASLADKIIVLDGEDDKDESLTASCSISAPVVQPQAKDVFQPKVQQPVASHITHSPFVSAKKDAHALQAENERLFGEVR